MLQISDFNILKLIDVWGDIYRFLLKVFRMILLAVICINLFHFVIYFSCKDIARFDKSEGSCETVYYKDFDRDRYSDGVTSCTQEPGFSPASELIGTFGDCDDSDPMVYPGSSTGDIICK